MRIIWKDLKDVTLCHGVGGVLGWRTTQPFYISEQMSYLWILLSFSTDIFFYYKLVWDVFEQGTFFSAAFYNC